jgi:hypothetical protein
MGYENGGCEPGAFPHGARSERACRILFEWVYLMFFKKMTRWAVMTVLLFLFAEGVSAQGLIRPEGAPDRNRNAVPAEITPVPDQALSREEDLSARIVSPERIDLGVLRPGEETAGIFSATSVERAMAGWIARVSSSWEPVGEAHATDLIGDAAPLRVALRYVKEVQRFQSSFASLVLRLESGGRSASFRREAPVGELGEIITLHSMNGVQAVLFVVRLEQTPVQPVLWVDERRMDLGTAFAGEVLTRRIRLANKGKEPLEWKTRVASADSDIGDERYVSFRRDKATTDFASTEKSGLELSGGCAYDHRGYPVCEGADSLLRFAFTGTGLKLYFQKSPQGGIFSAYLDDHFIELFDSHANISESAETFIVEGQPHGSHVLALSGGNGKTTFEGVGLFGEKVRQGPKGWISLFPDSGTTTRETDYVTVSVSSRGLEPGFYGRRIVFSSNGGRADVYLSLEVKKGAQGGMLDIHRYVAGADSLFTVNPQTEEASVKARRYEYKGVAFRLFAPGTPGTTEFFRWYSPSRKDHFYTHERDCAKALPGYVFEGAIGNIGTSRLTKTRALYQWRNQKTGCHFYTTDPTGDGVAKDGFSFEGIVGYVQ